MSVVKSHTVCFVVGRCPKSESHWKRPRCASSHPDADDARGGGARRGALQRETTRDLNEKASGIYIHLPPVRSQRRPERNRRGQRPKDLCALSSGDGARAGRRVGREPRGEAAQRGDGGRAARALRLRRGSSGHSRLEPVEHASSRARARDRAQRVRGVSTTASIFEFYVLMFESG